MKIKIEDAIAGVEGLINSFVEHDIPEKFIDAQRKILAELLEKKNGGQKFVEDWEINPRKEKTLKIK